jgi:glycosyltransferase involved in cell wall biosynthesis
MGMEISLVYIMIPTYNQENYLEKTIQSALDQDYPNIEVVVSDDLSTDNTKGVLALLE